MQSLKYAAALNIDDMLEDLLALTGAVDKYEDIKINAADTTKFKILICIQEIK